ncbi:MAG: hypothetical protein U0361_24990, partial [Nitrospiraceae bacterium]
MHRPLPGHDVLNHVPPAHYALTSQSGLAILPASTVILDRLEDHSQPSAAEPSVRRQHPKCFANLIIVRPVAAYAGLAYQ